MGKIFGGRYEIRDKIGAGGMAIVYRAEDLLLNRIVTVKVLREQFAADEEFITRFRLEAQAAAGLSHPNIVSIYDVGHEGETEYIVMEYVQGHNLKEIIREHAPLSPGRSLYLVRQIARAIGHVHEHHVIHRDIKPHNILVTADDWARVTDFGIAQTAEATTLTHTGNIVGSVHYLSPEQARGEPSGEQSDLYSLGIILYELVTGKLPYDGETPIAVALKHVREHPESPRQLNPQVSPSLEAIIMRAIAKDPEQRYPSAQAFLADLDKIEAEQSVAGPNNLGNGFENGDIEKTQIHQGPTAGMMTGGGNGNPPAAPARLAHAGNALAARVRKTVLRRRFWVGLGAAAAVFLAALFWLHSYASAEEVTVPAVTGQTVTEAAAILGQSHLRLAREINRENSNEVAKNLIIQQEPAEKSLIKTGGDVRIWVSNGPANLTMPDVKDQDPPLSKDAALALIKGVGFINAPLFTYVPSPLVPSGAVIDQNPAPDTPWPANGKIRITLSSGLPALSMPDVIGMSSEEAESALTGTPYNLAVVIAVKDSPTYPRGAVMSTDPNPGNPVEQGTTATVIVSSGSEPEPPGSIPSDAHGHKKGPKP
ncbi:Protein kinase domain protein [Acididesulfobacillus acetoxydans]|uniref:non-specific serine/threonine protein kinase n=1 Tax=Acididesulfobacillus acetoxydans TaxID=1561005 RepID=A0A8S0Y3S9_9FIRM|nr:Stk1 family PASTA domain-containing Ser/Thr kinase [Acididesulfobacillus acetoxydans]CAA7602375.1 Protein kinase domain protein [Acididesulfobacillus acetoxydans]CEJ08390.1 Serine/threonine-protein kinase PrkC [Acididesulfobacillus acetoxydans]